MIRMFNHIAKFQNAWRHYSNFERGCCCCENIQIAPRVHYASTHSLNTWTRPPPALTLSAMVPNSCGWRMAWGAQWCRDCPGDPSATTYYCVCVYVCVCALWHDGLCLFDIAALCSSLIVAKTMDIVSAATKRSSFFRPLKPELTTISHPPGDAWRQRAGPGASSVGRIIAAFTYGWSQRREAYYTVAIPCRQHCTSLVGTGIFLVAGE